MVSLASSTSTERPARASTIAAARPFGPEPTTIASYSLRPAPVPLRRAQRFPDPSWRAVGAGAVAVHRRKPVGRHRRQAVAVRARVAVPIRVLRVLPIARDRRPAGARLLPDGQERLEQLERTLRVTPDQHDPGRVVTHPLVWSQGGADTAEDGNADPHSAPDEQAADRTLGQVGSSPCQADVAPLPGHLAIAARPDDADSVGAQQLALGVRGAIVPAPQERCDQGADALGPVAELLLRDHRRQLDDADALFWRRVGALSEPHPTAIRHQLRLAAPPHLSR